jgi:hypothetical protein
MAAEKCHPTLCLALDPSQQVSVLYTKINGVLIAHTIHNERKKLILEKSVRSEEHTSELVVASGSAFDGSRSGDSATGSAGSEPSAVLIPKSMAC